uniref:Uncharacterized protein n=1 Tax=Cucumis sativus TaxID=3659 RepID=A0A0A0LSI9_CUCSA
MLLSQRVTRCFREACINTGNRSCLEYIDCGHGDESRSQILDPHRDSWTHNVNATACFGSEGFDYGIYLQAVKLTTKNSIITRYTYSLFWGFQVFVTNFWTWNFKID